MVYIVVRTARVLAGDDKHGYVLAGNGRVRYFVGRYGRHGYEMVYDGSQCNALIT